MIIVAPFNSAHALLQMYGMQGVDTRLVEMKSLRFGMEHTSRAGWGVTEHMISMHVYMIQQHYITGNWGAEEATREGWIGANKNSSYEELGLSPKIKSKPSNLGGLKICSYGELHTLENT